MEDTRHRVREIPGGSARLETGFEDGASAYAEVFRVALGPRFRAGREGDGWTDLVDPRVLMGVVAYVLGVSAIGGIAGFSVGGPAAALTWALFIHPPVGVVALSFLLFYGLVLQRPSEEPIQTDAVGIRVGARRWAWREVASVHGGNTLLVAHTKRQVLRRPGLVIELVDGSAVGWQVEPGSGDLVALVQRLEAMRRERSAEAPAEKAAVERLGDGVRGPRS
ncbi:MAG: hypothetical protein H6737_27705 [Alphaproteobacteria bacterium]|nr:hypothetical protein [Alphaproteobacteria bacterium]